MDPEEKTPPTSEDSTPSESPTSESSQQAPADALSKTPEELDQEQAEQAAANPPAESSDSGDTPKKRTSGIKKLFKKVNLYFLGFMLVLAIGGVVTAVNYLNSKKAATEAGIAGQELTEDALKQLANTDVSVGNSSQTLTIQGNAIISGQTLMRGNLNVAGNLQTGGGIQGPSLIISGTSNLGETQISGLQVANNTAVQGTTTLRDLNVAGASSFSGAVTASQITVTRLVMSGNAELQIPNHIRFTGPPPSRDINTAVLGGGGSASVNGSDASGTVNINTGNNPSPGCFVKITFSQRYSNQPHVIISPIGRAAGQTQFYVDRDNSSFSICTANAAPANQAFGFDYFITN